MAFPQTAAPTATAVTALGKAHSVSLPPTLAAGDLVLVVVSYCFLGTASAPAADTPPAGWTVEATGSRNELNSMRTTIFTRIVTNAGEGGTAVDFATTTNAVSASHAYRITAWFGQLSGVESSAAANDNNVNPNPGSLTPSWGSADTLWLAVFGETDDVVTVLSFSANFTGGVHTVANGGANGSSGVASARREEAVSSQDPGAATLNSGEAWVAFTVGVRPAAAAGGRIMSSLAGSGGLAGPGGTAGAGGGLAG